MAIRHKDITGGIDRCTIRKVEKGRCSYAVLKSRCTYPSKRRNYTTAYNYFADTVIIHIRHEQITDGINGYVSRVIETGRCTCALLKLPRLTSSRKGSHFSSAYNYFADTVVADFCNKQITACVNGYAHREPEIGRCACAVLNTIRRAARKCSNFTSGYNYFADTVATLVCNKQITACVNNYPTRGVENGPCACAILSTLSPATRKGSHFSSAYNYFADTVVGLVCNKQIAACVNG